MSAEEALPAESVSGRRAGFWARLGGPLLLVIFAIAAVLRFVHIGDNSLWIDEAYSIWVSKRPLGELWRDSAELDLHPPLYYALLHGWLHFGDSEAVARSLSAAFSALTVLVVGDIGWAAGGRAVGLMSGLLFALSPLQIQYAQEARMYALMSLLAALSIASLVHLMTLSARREAQSPSRSAARWRMSPRFWWTCFVLSTALLLYTHNSAVLEPAAIVLFVLASWWLRRSPRIAAIFSGLLVAFVLWLPWLPNFVAQSRRVDADFWVSPPTPTTVVDYWADLSTAFGPASAGRVVLLAALAGLVFFGCWCLRPVPDVIVLMLSLLFFPPVAELVISIQRPIFLTQTLLWTAVPLVVLVSAGLVGIRPRKAAPVLAAAAVFVSLAAIVSYYRYPGKEDWRSAVEFFVGQKHSADTVLFSAAWAQLPFDYYYGRYGTAPIVQRGLPGDVLERRALEPKMTPGDISRIDELVAGRQEVWVVYSHDWYTDPQGLVSARMASLFTTAEVHDFRGARLVRYSTGTA